MIFEILWIVLPIFLLVFVGFLLKRIYFLSDEFVKNGNTFNFYLTLPCSLFISIYSRGKMQISDLELIIFSTILLLLTIVLLIGLVKSFNITNFKRGAFVHAAFRSNFLILGLPLSRSLFGIQGQNIVASLLAFMIPLFNLLAILILIYFDDRQQDHSIPTVLKSILKNPLVLSSLLALIIVNIGISLPSVFEKSIQYIANMATPFSLIILGAQLQKLKVAMNLRLSLLASALRIILIPTLVCTAAILYGFRGVQLGGIFILFSAPTAITSYIVSLNMNSDHEMVAQTILFTTLWSVLTMSLGITILKTLGYL